MSAAVAYQDVPRRLMAPIIRAAAWLQRLPPARLRAAELGLLALIAYGLGMAVAFGI
ncbi:MULTISPECIES: hypothetical protein [unclassified Rhizobium]